jgi:hypothetical protein
LMQLDSRLLPWTCSLPWSSIVSFTAFDMCKSY